VTTSVETGDLKQQLSEATRVVLPDLVVMGSHARSGLDRWLMGSMTESTVRRSPVPVLSVPEVPDEEVRSPGDIERILVATDFLNGTWAALGHAEALAAGDATEIVLLHAVENPQDAHEALVNITEAFERQSYSSGRPRERYVPSVEIGHADEKIVEVAERADCDLVIMNVNDKGLLERLLHGMTINSVLRRIRRPVLAVPSDPSPR
jgi:nucleotide-binding universal stress UspA family protein